jgi:hypothetical protein
MDVEREEFNKEVNNLKDTLDIANENMIDLRQAADLLEVYK